MANEWHDTSLGALTDWASGGTPPKANPDYWGGDIPWISASSMKSGRLSESDRTLTLRGLERGSRLARKNDVLLLVRGSELHKRIPVGIAARDVAFNQDVKALRTKNEITSRFLYYWLTGNEQMLLAKVEHTGIGAGKLDTEVLKSLPIHLPPVPEQHAISHILGTLDDKIELNWRSNETLESMARALFKAWFVDFEPVRAIMDGRWQRGHTLPGLPEHLYDLFPSRLVKSELGEIPDGWRLGSLGEVAVHPRRSVQPGEIKDETAYIALEHMPKRSIALTEWGVANGVESNKYGFKCGEILFGKLRPYFHKVGVAPVDGVCSTDIVVITPKLPIWFGFVLSHTSSDAFVEYTNAGSTGTKMPRTSWSEMARYAVVLPHEDVAAAFNQHIQAVSEEIIANIQESKCLAQLRDTLLPKLISGELRVSDAERFLQKGVTL